MVSVTERMKTLFFSPLQPRNAGGVGGGGGGEGGQGGYPVSVSLQAPTSAAAVSADSHPFAKEVFNSPFRPSLSGPFEVDPTQAWSAKMAWTNGMHWQPSLN